jgi:hypothetical protein
MPNLLLFVDDAIRITAKNYNRPALQDLNDDLSSYVSGQSYIQTGHTMRRNGITNNWSSLQSQGYAFFGGVPQIAFSTTRAQRGEVLSTIAATSVGIASYPTLSAVINPAVRFLLPFSIGATGTAVLASMIAVIPAYQIGKAAMAGVRYFNSFGYKLRRIEMGGDYQDSATAQNLRMKAISDMSSAMSYSRRWLGNEAQFMRQ